MNVRGIEKKLIAVIICFCFLFQIIFRSFIFDSTAASTNILIGLIFRDSEGYHIRNVSSFLDSEGKLTLPTPRDLGDTNDESYFNWSPVLVENSFENIKNIILNGGNIEIEDYDVSRPPVLATSSVATSSIATSSIATYSNTNRDDLVIRTGFSNSSNAESGNANIILYRSNVYFDIGRSVQITRANSLNTVNTDMRRFVSKNGNKNQIFFLAVQPVIEHEVPHEVHEDVQLIERPRMTNSITVDTIGESGNNTEDTGAGRTDSVERTDRVGSNVNTDRNISGSVIRNNITNRDIADNNTSQTTDTEIQNTPQSVQTGEVTDVSNEVPQFFQPIGTGNSVSERTDTGRSINNVRHTVSINRDIVNNRGNGFLNTRSTYVNVDDNDFNENNYSVSVYKNVNGKEVLSNAKYTWSSEGGNHRANILFDDDGEYRIAVVKNNQGSGSGKVRFEEKFNVDATAPHITITGVEDLTANARTVSPVVKYSDVNIDLLKSKITLTSVADGKSRELIYKAKKQDGGYILNLDPIYIDDNYILTVTIYDMAGNVTEKKVNFSVNKKGATFKFKPEELVGQYTNKPFKSSIEVWNTDEISIVSATINGMDEPFEFVNGELKFLKSIDKDGKYTFNLEVTDTAGNKSSMKPVEVIYDATKPVAMILGVEDKQTYEGNVNIILSTELPGDFIESVWLDDKLLDKSEYTIKDDGTINLSIYTEGKHTVKAQGKDSAGNLSDIASVSFEIKAPQAKLLSAGYIPLAVITLGIALGLGIVFVYKKRKEE
jgi:hypothetical protein